MGEAVWSEIGAEERGGGVGLPPIRPYAPTTFLDRGVLVPFTTPVLGGTRARLLEGQELELMVPNPSGGRGVYILTCGGVASFCRPTLHDRELNRRLGQEIGVSPSLIRRVAQSVAADGLAGEEAREAAAESTRAEAQARVVAHYRLLMALVEQSGLAVPARPDMSEAAMVAERASLVIDHVARRLGRTPSWTAAALERIADFLCVSGIGGEGRVPSIIGLLEEMAGQLQEWTRSRSEEDERAYADMVCQVADHTLRLARALTERWNAQLGDVAGMLAEWAADPAAFAAVASRPEWLLDGWEQVCMVWRHAADEPGRRAALAEMATLVPVLPREAAGWCRDSIEGAEALRFRKFIRLHEDWLTGVMDHERLQRNESFRAESLRLRWITSPSAPMGHAA